MKRILTLAAAALIVAACSDSMSGPTYNLETGRTPAPPPMADQLCGAQFVNLYNLTGSIVDEFLKDRDRDGLQQKVAEAAQKVREEKIADSQQKLTQFGNKVEELRDAAKPKLQADNADTLLDALDAVLACLGLPPFDRDNPDA